MIAYLILVVGLAYSAHCGGGGDVNGGPLECPKVCRCSVVMEKNVTVCQERGLTEIPNTISNGTNFLDLSANSIGILENYAFRNRGLVKVESLALDSTGIRTIERNAFGGLKWLKELDLSNNSIVSIDSFVFAENKILEMVNFSGNPILKLSSFQLTALPYLKSLDFRNCALKEVENEAFSNLLSVETLNLKNNQLATLPRGIFTWLVHLKSLDLRENPWRCDCNVQNVVVQLVMRKLYSANLSCTYESDNETSLWHRIDRVDEDCIPTIEESVKENLMSSAKRLNEPNQFHVMDTSTKLTTQYVEFSFVLVAVIIILISLSLFCLIICYRKCCRRNTYKRRTYGFEDGSYNNYDYDDDDYSDISVSIEL